ncbi:MAG: glycoside hydrolase domain-containing protein [Planctomycetota bacterium]
MGINSKGAKLTAPYIEGFQDAALFLPGDEILIAPGKGRLLILI